MPSAAASVREANILNTGSGNLNIQLVQSDGEGVRVEVVSTDPKCLQVQNSPSPRARPDVLTHVFVLSFKRTSPSL